MSETGCEGARESIPGFVRGDLEPRAAAEVAAHLATCEECGAEADLVRLMWASRPEPPSGLASRIERAVGSPRTVQRPWWGVAAAAVAALALGIGVTRGGDGEVELPSYVSSAAPEDLWLSDDGLIAGAPALEDLSEEALAELLEELAPGGQA